MKESFNKFNEIEIMSSIFPDHEVMKVEINYREKKKKKKTLKTKQKKEKKKKAHRHLVAQQNPTTY